jgi:RNA polymerase sigma-70 factor (ECF subfamily)
MVLESNLLKNKPMNPCDAQHFSVFYQKHAQSLFRYLYYTFGKEAEAQDISQNVFVKIWEQCHKMDGSKLKSLIYTMARNEALNVIKHEKVVLAFSAHSPQRDDQEFQTPEFLLEQEEFKSKLEGALSALKADERQVFLMNRIDGMKYQEIADALGISVKTVEKRMHHVLLSLRAQIKGFNR